MIDIVVGTYLQTLTSFPVQQDVIQQGDTESRVWYQRTNATWELFTNGSAGLVETDFAVEVMGLNIDSVQTEADNIRSGLNGYQGTLSGTFVHAIFVEDASDDYESKNLGSDDGFHLVAYTIKVITG